MNADLVELAAKQHPAELGAGDWSLGVPSDDGACGEPVKQCTVAKLVDVLANGQLDPDTCLVVIWDPAPV